jgi:LPXTG-motif cell wall-anchored protein
MLEGGAMASGAIWFVAVVVVLIVGLVLWFRRRRNNQDFSPDQLHLITGVLEKEIQAVRKERKALIDEAAKQGKTISTERALRHVVELRSQYARENRHEDVRTIDSLMREIREKYGPEIRVDEADRLADEIEQRLGSVS